MPGRIPPIKEFPDDGRIWRIEWLGAVEQTQPETKIDVHLCEGLLVKAKPGQPKPPDPTRMCVKVGVGQLPYLTLGSVWRNRRRLSDQSIGSRRRMTNLQIDGACVGLISLDCPVGETNQGKRKWLVPPFSYPLPRTVYKSFCLAIEHDGDPFAILLPVTEAIRFYYALSSDLAHVMFSGMLQMSPEDVYGIESSGMLENSQRMVVARTRWLADNDCWIIGRVLGDQHARNGADRIYDSLAKATANSAAAFPECELPFRGPTDWTVRAVDVSIAGESPKWLILEIEKCTAAFPFDELEVIADNDGSQAPEETDIPDGEKMPAWQVPKKQASRNADDQLQSSEAPSAGVEQAILSNPGECFEALKGKRIIKTPKSECRYKSGQLQRVPDAGKDIGTGNGTHGETDVKPGEVVWDRHEDEQRKRSRRKALGASFEVLYDVVDAINTIGGAEAWVRESKALSYIPMPDLHSRRQWAWLDSSKRIRRETLLIDIVTRGRHACLVEFQQRPGEHCVMGLIVCREKRKPDDAEIKHLLFLLAKKHGRWKNVKCPFETIVIESIPHRAVTIDRLAEAVVATVAP